MNTEAKQYFKALHRCEREAVCKRCGISYSWLIKLLYTDRQVSTKLAKRLEKATMGAVKKEDLRPDINWELVAG